MINKNKILKATHERILTGFKFSSNKIDDSSYIDFNDSNVGTIESLNYDKLRKLFEAFIANGQWHNAIKYYQLYGLQYKVNDTKLIKLIVNDENVDIDLNLNWIDVSNVTDMSSCFTHTLFNGDISKWDVSNVINMNDMFSYSNFNGDISEWNVSSVEQMLGMFCSSNFNLDLSKWDVSNVLTMEMMFEKSKFNLDISRWNVSNVDSMESMFQISMFNQDISNWDINTEFCNFYKMFDNCPITYKNKPNCLKDIE